jgi:carbonic anhydrase
MLFVFIKVAASPNTSATSSIPRFTNYLGKTFEMKQFHFHWGENDFVGSEHLINSKRYPLEIHMVHQSSDQTYSVLGFLFDV